MRGKVSRRLFPKKLLSPVSSDSVSGETVTVSAESDDENGEQRPGSADFDDEHGVSGLESTDSEDDLESWDGIGRQG